MLRSGMHVNVSFCVHIKKEIKGPARLHVAEISYFVKSISDSILLYNVPASVDIICDSTLC